MRWPRLPHRAGERPEDRLGRLTRALRRGDRDHETLRSLSDRKATPGARGSDSIS